MVRQILVAYEDADQASLTFARGRQGKPRLIGPDLQFSLSSGGDFCVLVVQHGYDRRRRREGARSATDREHRAKLFHAN
jgi:phosphopantetheinyl transferase